MYNRNLGANLLFLLNRRFFPFVLILHINYFAAFAAFSPAIRPDESDQPIE